MYNIYPSPRNGFVMCKHFVVSMKLIIILLLIAFSTGGSMEYDHYLLSCGAPTGVANTSSTWDGRTWYSDDNSTFSDDFSPTIVAQTTTSVPNPFSRARVFISNFSYHFPVSPGPKFIRLFFYVSLYPYLTPFLKIISATDAYITVQANSDQILLRNFNAAEANSNSNYVQKEFYVYVTGSVLQLTFSPSPPSSYSFINGIEVVSIPDNLYFGSPTIFQLVDGRNTEFDNSTILETAYRVNVGGREINSSEDTGGRMYRHWVNDDPYLIGDINGITDSCDKTCPTIKYSVNYSAPVEVYQTFRSMGVNVSANSMVNLTWGFEVDFGFFYLVRLHWCELVSDINRIDQRVFDVYIDYQLAYKDMDVIGIAGSNYDAVYRDYVVYMNNGDVRESRGLLQLALHPNIEFKPEYYDALLNGLEIFKVNNANGSLNAQFINKNNTDAPDFHGPRLAVKSSKRPKLIIGGAIGGIVLLSSVVACVHVFRRMNAINKTKGSSMSSCHASHRFPLAQIKLATNDFSEKLIIGYGGFGNVYKAMLYREKVRKDVAIKRLNPSSKQGAHEFNTEIEMLSRIRHFHLVSLLGFCDENGEMILVYDYMENGTLRDHLYNTNNPPLSWNLRLSICLGAAKGLHYLHAGVGQMIIHRDVKSTNILLDENWVPKVSDFGLSKLGPIGGNLHVSTAVKGSFGYMDPEYYMLQQLTEKSDVYSFGVVLFEVLCGRAAIDPTLPWEQVNLAMYARTFQKRGALEEIIDPSIKDEIALESLTRFGEIAERCVREHRTERPTMADVVCRLELALALQQQSDIMSNGNILDDHGLLLSRSQSASFSELQLSLSPT